VLLVLFIVITGALLLSAEHVPDLALPHER
jgi:hypothetical protein